MRTCDIEGCEKKYNAKGLCGMHYRRVKVGGAAGEPAARRRKPGEGSVTANGYRVVWVEGKQMFVHRIIAAKAVGRALKGTEEVHHFDGDTLNNDPSNLVVCPDRAYHKLLHVRQRALEECADANKRRCITCKTYDEPSNMRNHCGSYIHAKCDSERKRNASS